MQKTKLTKLSHLLKKIPLYSAANLFSLLDVVALILGILSISKLN
jgi:hypothetical protein